MIPEGFALALGRCSSSPAHPAEQAERRAKQPYGCWDRNRRGCESRGLKIALKHLVECAIQFDIDAFGVRTAADRRN